jgi:murein DD-endopeptidase MepM/ murein hydrolase activator NlpD
MLFAGPPAALGARKARPPKGGDLERKRDQARLKQEEVRRDLDLAQASETELEKHIGDIAADLADRQVEASAAQADADQAAASVVKISGDIAVLKDQLIHRKGIFNKRAVMAYMGGQGRPLDDLSLAGQLLSLPGDLTDVARRGELVREVQEQDNDAYTALAETQEKLKKDEAALTEARDRAKQRSADAKSAVEAVARLKKDQEAAKAVLDQRISALTAEADALAAEQSKLEELIKQRQAALEAARRARAAAGQAARDGLNRLPRTGAGVSPTGFIWPIERGVVTSGFGRRWGRMHTGIDIGAPAGTPIHAAKAGEVIFTGWLGGYGNAVIVDHGDGVATLYGHQSRLGSTEGQQLNQGDVLGFVGSTGHSTGNHCHFEIRINTKPVNPRPYLP